jgi:hypothetical protein
MAGNTHEIAEICSSVRTGDSVRIDFDKEIF